MTIVGFIGSGHLLSIYNEFRSPLPESANCAVGVEFACRKTFQKRPIEGW